MKKISFFQTIYRWPSFLKRSIFQDPLVVVIASLAKLIVTFSSGRASGPNRSGNSRANKLAITGAY